MKEFKKNFILLLSLLAFLLTQSGARAATNISATSTDHWAWNDIVGWIDFYNTQTITVASANITGYASSSAADVSLDCATARAGNGCLPPPNDYHALNDGNGNLSGWAWNDAIGWISFCGGQGIATCPGGISYSVYINPTTGDFSGYAWNDAIGWISFCGTPGGGGGCVATSFSYKINTGWRAVAMVGVLDSSTFDTGVAGGAEINSVLWQGALPAGTEAHFKIAASNSASGPWIFLGPAGTQNDPTNADFYGPPSQNTFPNTSIPLDYTLHNNQRYFRYRIILISDQAQQNTPRVDDVIVNWSP